MSAAALQLGTAATAGTQQIAAPHATKNVATAKKAAEDFEAVFINEFLGSMFSGLATDGAFDGGPSEGIFRSMMVDEYAKNLAKQGGFGIANAVSSQLLQVQEARP